MTNFLALVIEDDARLATVFSEALKAAGFETQIALDGAVAQEKLAASVPDVVVLDLHLPHVPGPQLLREIRADERLAQTKVVIVTADALAPTQERLEEMANLVFIKPVSFDQLRIFAERLRPGEVGE